MPIPALSDVDVLAARGPKNTVDPRRPYAVLVEPEYQPSGRVEDVATIFLTNRECPFRCIFCDLWKNTTDRPVPPGAIPAQIDDALARLPPARHVKLYNSGNFFDPGAIPPADYPAIADRLAGFETVIVENHPRLCGDACQRFAERLAGHLEIALGLETAHPEILPRLNKRMTLDDFTTAAARLTAAGIRLRTFILLRPPPMSEAEGVEWAVRSLEFAFDAGVECCAVIPTRVGNGLMEQLAAAGQFAPPRLRSLEQVLATGLAMRRGRVLADLWDVERLAGCAECGPRRIARLREMNLTQDVPAAIACGCQT